MIAHPIRMLTAGTLAMALGVPAYAATAATAPTALTTRPSADAAASPTDAGPRPQVRTDLAQAMRGEAFANLSYLLFAAQAQRERLPGVARLFHATARTELDEHFTEAAALARTVGGDDDNLLHSIAGETYESRVMYPRYARQARADRENAAAELFSEIAKDEAAHRVAFTAALGAVRTSRDAVPAPPSIRPVAVPAGPAKVHAARTLANVHAALRGEALAHARYTLFGRHAARIGNTALARLFLGVAEVERREHFAGEAVLAGLVRGARANLRTAIAGERYEARTMYPTFARDATAAGDAAAATLFRHNAADEARHGRAFLSARLRLR